ncbi:MAG: SDR family NAD(P)-dependent oxidoreductase [Gammaproteobacteria bacterium]
MARLAGKVALVSGSGRGIGRAIALKLAGEGARIVVNDLDDAPAAQVVEEIRAIGAEAVACCGDVAAADFGTRFVACALDAFGGIDIIVNNAGYAWLGMVQNTTDAQFQAMLEVHLVAPFRILRAAAGFLRDAAKAEAAAGRPVHRKVVNVSSGSVHGVPGHSGYASGKAGVVGLTRTLAQEWGRYRVNVNAVAFGLIRTRMNEPLAHGEARTLRMHGVDLPLGMDAGRFAQVEGANALGRAGTPQDAANAVYLFCTPESDFITGQLIFADGG